MGLHELEEVDPSLADGHRIFYEREVPFELRSAQGNEEPREVGALEAIRVKILALGDEVAFTGSASLLEHTTMASGTGCRALEPMAQNLAH